MSTNPTKVIPKGAQKLSAAGSSLLQVVVQYSDLQLTRAGEGVHLRVEFGEDSDAINNRFHKAQIPKQIAADGNNSFEEIADEVQSQLDKVLFDTGRCEDGLQFAFRYGNGGTLPILSIGQKNYYCLFFRDVDPAGWNIANGAADSLAELIDPTQTILRELFEELIIFDSARKTQYLPEVRNRLLLPEFIFATGEWRNKWRKPDFSRVYLTKEKCAWLNGPDLITISFGNTFADVPYDDVFITVTADDCAIEVDRIVQLAFNNIENITLVDGELYGHALLNRPIGLFELDYVQETIGQQKSEEDARRITPLFPDYLFFGGDLTDVSRDPEVTTSVVGKFLKYLKDQKIRSSDYDDERGEQNFCCCPVTFQLIRRHMELGKDAQLPLLNIETCKDKEKRSTPQSSDKIYITGNNN